jgi:hypothetical protein
MRPGADDRESADRVVVAEIVRRRDPGEELASPGVEGVEAGPVLDDHPDGRDGREGDHQRRHLRDLARAQRGGHDHEQEPVREEQRELLDGLTGLAQVLERLEVEQDADHRDRPEGDERPVDRAHPRPLPPADHATHAQDPEEEQPDEHGPVERRVERHRDRQVRVVEREEPEHHQEGRDAPRQ